MEPNNFGLIFDKLKKLNHFLRQIRILYSGLLIKVLDSQRNSMTIGWKVPQQNSSRKVLLDGEAQLGSSFTVSSILRENAA